MSSRIYRAILLSVGLALLAGLLVTLGCLYGYFGGVMENQLRDQVHLAAAGVEEGGTDYLSRISSDRYRITWIQPDGSVLYDTKADPSQMENHLDRSEVQEALRSGDGQGERYSSTLMEKTFYYAQRLSDGTVLRMSASTVTAAVLAYGMLQPLLVVLAAALVLAGLLAGRLARRITDPLNDLDLDHPLDNASAYEELSPLLRRINDQHEEIDGQLHALQKKTDEFDQITRNMQEGLVLLNEKQQVLSINAAAEKLFGAQSACVGQDFLTLDRSHEMTEALHQALQTGHGEFRSQRNSRWYQFDISRIDSQGSAVGAVILSFDSTQQERAEQSRREFTANVSHELKTPLQGIIGSAELMENGLVKPEDMPRFIGHIHTEAARMVTLIEDIIRLSQLDEGDQLPQESVDVLAIAQEAAASLQEQAKARNVTLTVSGQRASICGAPRLVYEIVYNLCDNAIKYNREGGRAAATVVKDGGQVIVTVSDTGIGIPPADQDRVFERFYRVDKSHSKASGGTGLGLSIVKHAVRDLHGKITLTSTPGQGTVIQIVFPAET